jgi:protein-S-isoprenylcysteine O-methyltransferase Ste14
MRHAAESILATIVVPGTAVGVIPWLILRQTGGAAPTVFGPLEILALAGAIAGAGMVIWVSFAFVRQGHGTPIPVDPPTTFVASGLFRYVRNPMYFGALLVLASEVIFFRSVAILVFGFFLWLALHSFLVIWEEPQLKRRFGATYLEYVATTPRWFPRIPRGSTRGDPAL